ncbi:nucleotide-binding alpha-beta plait domain-containing protein, partial [Tanacetum coccineum]
MVTTNKEEEKRKKKADSREKNRKKEEEENMAAFFVTKGKKNTVCFHKKSRRKEKNTNLETPEMIKPLQQTNKSHEDSSGDGGTNPAGICSLQSKGFLEFCFVLFRRILFSSSMGSFRSKEDDVSKISTSIFITNFPETFSAKDLFLTCRQYGHVVDTFIPVKRSKGGKRFGFVRFINVFSIERLVNNLCTIWVGRLKLHANVARFQRTSLGSHEKKNTDDGPKRYAHIPNDQAGSSTKDRSFVNVLKGVSDTCPAIVIEDDCLLNKDLSVALMGRVNEFSSLLNIKNALMNEGFVDINIRYLGELWILLEFSNTKTRDAFSANVSARSWFSVLRPASNDFFIDGRIVWVEVEGVPFKLWSGNTFNRISLKWGKLIDIDDKEG